MRTVLFFAWPQFDAAEVVFWRRLRDALRERDLRLVLACDGAAPADLGVDVVRVPRRIDSTWPFGAGPVGRVPLQAIGLDPAELLAREAAWGEPSVLPGVEAQRIRGIEGIASHWATLLAWLRPVVTIIWNGEHVPELVLGALCRAGNCPVLTAERAPVPRALFVDDAGLSADSAVARLTRWQPDDPGRWEAVAQHVNARLAAGRFTWWEQPEPRAEGELRARLNAPAGRKCVLFAGQVDEDTQQFLFSPHFPGNLEALRWFLRRMSGRADVFVVGKHHPRSTIQPDAYRRELAASGVPGVWLDDVSIDDALGACDRVVAVNSTVLYEALARRIPALVLGRWLIGGRGAAYEIEDPFWPSDRIDRWLSDADGEAQARAWQTALAFLLERSLYAYETAPLTGGMHDADDLAERLAQRARCCTGWAPPPALVEAAVRAGANAAESWWTPWDVAWVDDLHRRLTADAVEWQQAQWIREVVKNGRKARREHRRLVIWGTGDAGRRAALLLHRAGLAPNVFGSSSPDPNASCLGYPVLAPIDLAGPDSGNPDYVLIATAASAEVGRWLESRGLTRPRDYDAFDIDGLLAATGAPPTISASAGGGMRRRD